MWGIKGVLLLFFESLFKGSVIFKMLCLGFVVPSFQMVLTLIGKDQKEQIEQLFDALMATPNKHFTVEEAQALSSEYYCSVSSHTSASQKADGMEA